MKKSLGTFEYESGLCPEGYRCAKCQAAGCKLWRQYQTFLNHLELLCLSCAEKDQDKKCEIEQGGSDQIGWLVPAVPTQDGETYWGYTSIPCKGCDWWDSLPLRRGEKSPIGELSPYMRRIVRDLKAARDFYRMQLGKLAKDVRESVDQGSRSGKPTLENSLWLAEHYSRPE